METTAVWSPETQRSNESSLTHLFSVELRAGLGSHAMTGLKKEKKDTMAAIRTKYRAFTGTPPVAADLFTNEFKNPQMTFSTADISIGSKSLRFLWSGSCLNHRW